jgi:hypothetical protein
LGKDFEVKSCYGHIRDLEKEDMGIDINNGYRPKFFRWFLLLQATQRSTDFLPFFFIYVWNALKKRYSYPLRAIIEYCFGKIKIIRTTQGIESHAGGKTIGSNGHLMHCLRR